MIEEQIDDGKIGNELPIELPINGVFVILVFHADTLVPEPTFFNIILSRYTLVKNICPEELAEVD